MNSLAPLPSEPLPYFTAIVGAKQSLRRERLSAISVRVQDYYKSYLENTGALAGLTSAALTEVEKEDLLHCYVSPTAPLSVLKTDIRAHHKSTHPSRAAVCQYCGLSYNVSSFDHYLPKELFPEFATLSANLVPSCHACNQAKGTAWVDEHGMRKIISFYFDPLPEQQFLLAEIEAGVVPLARFRLAEDGEIYAGLAETVRNHFRELGLLDRFSRAAPEQFSEIKEELASFIAASGIPAAADLLTAKAAALARSHSLNYWKVALYQAMAASEAFLNSCRR